MTDGRVNQTEKKIMQTELKELMKEKLSTLIF